MPFRFVNALVSKTKTGRTQAGFTLLEIVVAVGIFAVIAAIVFPALLQFLEIRDRINEKHKQLVELQKTFQFLSNDLRYAVNRLPKDEFGDIAKTTLLINDDNLLDVTAVYPDLSLAGYGVPRRVLWRLVDDQLERIQFPVMDPEAETRTITQSLLRGVQDVEIEVSYVEDGRDNTKKNWDEKSRLPDLIEVKVELLDDQEFNRLFVMQGGDKLRADAVNAANAQGGAGQAPTPANTSPSAPQSASGGSN